MYDIIFVGEKTEQYKILKDKFLVLKYAKHFRAAQKMSATKMCWIVWDSIVLEDSVDFSYTPESYDQKFIHVFRNDKHFDGVCLVPKHAVISDREIEYRFFAVKKEIDINYSYPRLFDIFNIETIDDYNYALQNSTTDMFWMISPNLKIKKRKLEQFYIPYHENVDRKQNHAFIHRVAEGDCYRGVFLCSKYAPLTEKEINSRFMAKKKDWDIVLSTAVTYDRFNISTYEEYTDALKTSKTEMFWTVPPTVYVDYEFMFDMYFTHDNVHDRTTNHTFLNGKYNDGIVLCSKHLPISEREWQFKFIANRKEREIVASTPRPYDVVFISYQEPDADENFNNLCKVIPNAKRVHGVKGIHEAHIQAAKKCTTPMIWIVDGDANIADDFLFDYQVPAWEYTHVHVWRSQNPINNLVYGYGGIKLFPRKLTEDMDTSRPDMTTSISDKFTPMNSISNITKFNTSPFETWKSAFRECCKLSSKVIARQKTDETQERLNTWQTVGEDKLYGEYAIQGAKAGASYGALHKDNIEELKKINDYDWLTEKFNGRP